MTSFEKISLHALKEIYPSFPIEECVHYNAGTNNNIILKKLTELNKLDCDDDEWFDYKPLEDWQRRGFEPIDYGAGVLLSVNGKKKICYSKQMVKKISKAFKSRRNSIQKVIVLKNLKDLTEFDTPYCDGNEWSDYKPLEEWQRRGFEPIDYGAGVLLSVNGKKKICYSKQMVIFIPKNNKTENESTPEVKVEVVIIEKIVEKIKIVEKPIIKRTIVEKPTIKEKIVYIDKSKQKTTKAVKQKDNSLSDIYKEKSEQNSNTLQRRAWINNDTGMLTKLLKFLGKM